MVITDQEFRKIISGTTPFMFDLYRQYNAKNLDREIEDFR